MGEADPEEGPAGERRASEPRTPGQGWPGWTSSEAGKRSDEVSPAERVRQGWRTLDLQAKQESEALQGEPWSF